MANLELCVRVGRWRSLICALLAAVLAVLAVAQTAEARVRRHSYGHHAFWGHRHHHGSHAYLRRGHHGRRHQDAADETGGEMLSPRGLAAIVVDGRSGRIIFGQNEHERRHPASVTKVMTLYLLFEQLEKGALRLDSPLMISEWAASQAPTKLGLRPGSSIAVEDAIKAVVTKSANDIAVAIAENIGGDEESFARMMTAKAHALGMNDSHFANASGLPNSEQITTAHDLAVLGRAIQERFPRYYRYFSTHSFAYRGEVMRNHNHLLGRVEGMDGIKTGYTRASGYNLLTSVRRGRRHIVAVVLGGRTAGARDRYMESLIERHIASAGEAHIARAEEDEPTAERGEARESKAAVDAREAEDAAVQEKPLAYDRAPAPRAEPSPAEAKARPAFVSGIKSRAEAESAQRNVKAAAAERAADDGSTSRAAAKSGRRDLAATTPSALKRAEAEEKTQVIKIEAARGAKASWAIQLGAVDDVDKANALLARARSQDRQLPASAKPYTEKVQKGHETLYRARFAGLEEDSAAAACRSLKRSGFSCFATKN